MLIARGQNIGALKSLVEVSEDVEYRDEALTGVSRTSHVCIDGRLAGNQGGNLVALTCFHASNLLVRALGDVSRGYDWWYVATCFAVAVSSRHGGHGSELAVVVDRGRWQEF